MHAAHLRELGGGRLGGGDVADVDADHRTADAPVLDEVVHDVARQVDRDSEAVALVVAGAGGDGRVDADDFTADVDERAARVALIDSVPLAPTGK